MKKLLSLMMLLVCLPAFAKVAYLPLILPDVFYPSSESILVFDMENNSIIKEIPIPGDMGDGLTPIYLNNTEQYLYVPYFTDSSRNMARINTVTLTVDMQWQNLPAPVDKMIISPDDSQLYFINLNVGTGNNSVYSIDLLTDQISEVINFSDSTIRQFISSEDGSHFVIHVYNHNTSQQQLITYETNDLSIKYTTDIDDYVAIKLVDNRGENYFYNDTFLDEFISQNLNDNNINWSYSFPNESFYNSPYEKDPQKIMVQGSMNIYEIDQLTGVGAPLFAQESNLLLRGSIGRVYENKFISIEYPLIVCFTGSCGLSSFLEINQIDLIAGTANTIYTSQNISGSSPIGKFIGENFFRGSSEPTAVPLLDQLWFLLLLGILMLLLTFTKLYNR